MTFLFTDVEGSTRLWDRDASAMGPALARHDAIVRDAVELHRGEVFKTWGDAFCAVFPTAGDGLLAALDLQRAMAGEPWGAAPIVVRCAVHTGAAEQRDGDYFGPPLNRVARLLAAAHGGQTLLSEAASMLAGDALPEGVALTDLGPHRLRDLEREEHIYQLSSPTLRAEFPPIRTLRARHDNVPAQGASFIGRSRECAELRGLLLHRDTRLVTLTGPGGCGKTRLAVQVGGSCIEDFSDGVCYVQLAAITDCALVAPEIARALDLREGGDSPIGEMVIEYLRDKSLLLVLDNFEQVLETAPWIAELVAACKVKVLVTSRELLHLYGEREYRVPPLDLPVDANDVTRASASILFVERAKLREPAFELTADNARPIAELCRKLDGLPLALELAAARIRLFSPQEMLERLDSRLNMLTGGARDLPERQRTMRGAIEWSDALLNDDERVLFHRLGVFSGGFTLDAAEDVCAVGADASVTPLISSLLDKSLLHRDARPQTEQRLSMLETVREYALERLESEGGLALMRNRHASWSLRRAELEREEIHGPRQLASLARCEDEHDNFRAALAWYAEASGTEGLRLAVALAPFWRLHGHLAEGRRLLAHGLQRAGSSPQTRLEGEALLWSGWLAVHSGDHATAEELLESSAGLARGLRETALHGRACTALGWLAIARGSIQDAVSRCIEAVELLRATSDTWGLADALHFLGHALADDTGFESAREAWSESLQLFKRLGDGSWALPLKDLGLIASRSGDHAAAAAMYDESLTLLREIGDKWHVADTLMRLGELALFAGDAEGAASRFREALSIARDLGNKPVIVEGLIRYAEVSEVRGDYDLARRLLDEGLGIARELSHQRLLAAVSHNLAYVALHFGEIHAAESLISQSTCLHRALDRDLEVALDLAAFGAVQFARGHDTEATRLYGASEALTGETGVMLRRADRLEFVVGQAELLSALRARLGDEAFERAWEEGRSLSAEDALAAADIAAGSPGALGVHEPAGGRD